MVILPPKYLTLLTIVVFLSSIVHWQYLAQFFFQYDTTKLTSAPRICSSTERSQSIITNFQSDEFMSPIAIKLLADAHYGTSSVPEEQRSDLRRLDLTNLISCLRPGAVIFVDSKSLNIFLNRIYHQIKIPFVLVSGDNDLSVPGTLNKRILTEVFECPESLIIHWFAMNCDRNLNASRFTCLINGISQWNGQREAMRNIYNKYEGIVAQTMAPSIIALNLTEFTSEVEMQRLNNNASITLPATKKSEYTTTDNLRTGRIVENIYKNNHWKNDSFSLLVSFNVKSNVEVRQPLWDQFCKDVNRTVKSLCVFSQVDMHTFYRLVSASRFVLSPHGKGLDCYRTYEALYLGAYAVVHTSSLDEMYTNLPVLIVNSWSKVTDSLLNDTFHRFRETKFDYDKLFTQYWFQKFRSFGYTSYSYE